MVSVFRSLAFVFGAMSATAVHADEGMWTFHNPPLDTLKAKYGFEPPARWLERLRLATLSIHDSASFVSPEGLVLTNAHVTLGCARDLSTPTKDVVREGFIARTRAEEKRCPGLDARQLVSYEDVTSRVSGADEAERSRRIAAVELGCREATRLRCEVVKLHRGAEAWLYRYRVWDDVRLVFQPEYAIAFFGGDTDNFVFPRYDLDVAFMRVYEHGKPVASPDHLRFAKKGVAEGDLVFSAGNPNTTDRQLTVAELLLLRDQLYPLRLSGATDVRESLVEYGKRSAEAKRQAAAMRFLTENAIKVWRGESKALLDARMLARKRGDEADLRQRAHAEAAAGRLRFRGGDPWERIEGAVQRQNERAFELQAMSYRQDSLLAWANDLVGMVREGERPDGERLEKFREGRLPALRTRLGADTPFHKDMEAVLIAAAVDEAMSLLGWSHPYVQRLSGGLEPEAAGAQLAAATRLDDPAVRRKLLDGGKAAVEASGDPLLVAVRELWPMWSAAHRFLEKEIVAEKEAAYDEIAHVRHQLAAGAAPDATGSLRFTFGRVAGYDRDGILTPWTTTFYGLFERHQALAANADFALPPRWKGAERKVALGTPFNFVSTLETIGGSSGSPVVNRDGDLVGVVFDGNLEGMGNRFAYSERMARSLAVDARAIREALAKIYGATALARELGATTAP